MNSVSKVVDEYAGVVREEFQKSERLLSFQSYIDHFISAPLKNSRNSALYLIDMMDWFGRREVKTPMGVQERWKVFDSPFEDLRIAPVVGHEEVQKQIYNCLKAFVQEGSINKLILLHGPNGSAKSSLFRCLIAGLETYSRTEAGAVHTFNWIFPEEAVYKKTIGLGASGGSPLDARIDSYALLDPEKVSAVIPCEMKDHPIFLLPLNQRKDFLKKCEKGIRDEHQKDLFPQIARLLIEGSLSNKSMQIFDALLTSYKGDLKKVLMHIQVERVYFSKRFQVGAVTVDPQMNVDATAHQVTMNRSLAYIPPALQSLNLFSLDGPLIQANRGMIEFNDLLKRPIEAFKYLLGTCETNIVPVGPSLAYLDEVMVGSCNEVQMEVFRDYPDFPSFRARMEFIQVPYMLRYSLEKEIYNQVVSGFAGLKHVCPYTTEILAMWAVLTRLRKPQLLNSAPVLKRVLEALSALEKAKLYDSSEIPSRLTNEESKVLKTHIVDVYREFQTSNHYEGRFGASAREMKMVLYHAAHTPDWDCVTVGRIVEELEAFVQRKTEYDFLRQDPSGGYYAHSDFIEVVRDQYLQLTDKDFKQAMGLAEESQFSKILERYAAHVKALLRNERLPHEVTGEMTQADLSLITRTEGMIDVNKDRDQFRRDVLTTIAAWAHDHPGQKLDYQAIFPDFVKRLKVFFHEEQRKTVLKFLQAILEKDIPDKALDSKLLEQTKRITETLKKDFGYCSTCINESASFLLKYHYTPKS